MQLFYVSLGKYLSIIMKKTLYILAALVFSAFSFSACSNKPEDIDEPVSIVGTWKYWGASTECEVKIDIFEQKIFVIDDNTVKVYPDPRMGTELTEEYSYTRKDNTITLTPPFLGKFNKVSLVQCVHPADGITFKCSEKSEYNFIPMN